MRRTSLPPTHLMFGNTFLPEDFSRRLEWFKEVSGLTWDGLAGCLGVDPAPASALALWNEAQRRWAVCPHQAGLPYPRRPLHPAGYSRHPAAGRNASAATDCGVRLRRPERLDSGNAASGPQALRVRVPTRLRRPAYTLQGSERAELAGDCPYARGRSVTAQAVAQQGRASQPRPLLSAAAHRRTHGAS